MARVKSEIEKQYITRIWMVRKYYLSAKKNYESSWGSYQDKERMTKMRKKMLQLQKELANERTKMRYRNVG